MSIRHSTRMIPVGLWKKCPRCHLATPPDIMELHERVCGQAARSRSGRSSGRGWGSVARSWLRLCPAGLVLLAADLTLTIAILTLARSIFSWAPSGW